MDILGLIEFYLSIKSDLYRMNHIIYERYKREKLYIRM